MKMALVVDSVSASLVPPLPPLWIPAFAGVSVLSVKGFQVAGTGDSRMRRLLPTQAGDEPLASRSLRPRYISPSPPPRLRPRIGVRGMLSIAGVTNREAGWTNLRAGLTTAGDKPQRYRLFPGLSAVNAGRVVGSVASSRRNPSRFGLRDVLWHLLSSRIDRANGFVIYCRCGQQGCNMLALELLGPDRQAIILVLGAAEVSVGTGISRGD